MPERSRREGQLFPWLCVISLHSLTGIFCILFVAGASVGAPAGAPVGASVGAPAGASAGASAGAPAAFPGRTSVDWLPVTAPSPWRRKVELQQSPRNLSDQSTRSKVRKARLGVFAPQFAILSKIALFFWLYFALFLIRTTVGNFNFLFTGHFFIFIIS
jgi:hypothetical protein